MDEGSCTNATNKSEPLTADKLREIVESLPKIVGYAVVVSHGLHEGMFTIRPPAGSRYTKIVSVPRDYLDKLRAEFGDRPSPVYPNAFEYPIYDRPLSNENSG